MTTLTSTTEYEVVLLNNGTYGVRIMSSDDLPVVADGFRTETEAENWIFSQQVTTITDDELPPHI